MTLKELSQLYWLKKEIAKEEERLAEIRLQVQSVAPMNYDGVKSGGKSKSDNQREKAMIALLSLEEVIEEKRTKCIVERLKIESWINKIEDSETRQIFRLRFVNCYSWVRVALSIGGNNTENSVKKICYRYLHSSKNE